MHDVIPGLRMREKFVDKFWPKKSTKAIFKEVICLQVMSHIALPYNKKQCELRAPS